MRVIVAGSRGITNYQVVKKAIEESGFEVTEVVSGKAAGVDTLGEEWAEENGIPVKEFPAEWQRFGKAAGHLRNGDMAIYGEALVAVMLPDSRGTLNMIKQAKQRGLPGHIVKI